MTKKEKDDFRRQTESESFKKEMRKLASKKNNPFIKDCRVNLDAYIDFLTQYNEFINHRLKAFKKIKGDNMKL